jgi:hypothetical protein
MRMTDNMLIDAVLDDLQVQGVQLAGSTMSLDTDAEICNRVNCEGAQRHELHGP